MAIIAKTDCNFREPVDHAPATGCVSTGSIGSLRVAGRSADPGIHRLTLRRRDRGRVKLTRADERHAWGREFHRSGSICCRLHPFRMGKTLRIAIASVLPPRVSQPSPRRSRRRRWRQPPTGWRIRAPLWLGEGSRPFATLLFALRPDLLRLIQPSRNRKQQVRGREQVERVLAFLDRFDSVLGKYGRFAAVIIQGVAARLCCQRCIKNTRRAAANASRSESRIRPGPSTTRHGSTISTRSA